MARAFQDPQGRHVRVYCSLLDSHAWRCLSWSARALFIDLRASLGKSNNGDIAATLGDGTRGHPTLKHKGWKSPATLSKALYELRALGFLIQTRGGGVEHGSKVCSLYGFTDQDISAFPGKAIAASRATHAYRNFATIAEAKQALREGLAQLRAEGQRKRPNGTKKNLTLQNLTATATESVATALSTATEIEVDKSLPLQKLKQTKPARKSRKPAPNKAPRATATAKPPESEQVATATENEVLYILPPQGADGTAADADADLDLDAVARLMERAAPSINGHRSLSLIEIAEERARKARLA